MITKTSSVRTLRNHKFNVKEIISIVLGKRCNFSCTYCYQHNIIEKNDITKDVIDSTLKYIFYRYTTLKENEYIEIDFIGGEPLLYINEINFILNKLLRIKNKISYINFPTNGFFIKKYMNEIVKWNNLFEGRLLLQISYDYTLQESNRKSNTSSIIKEGMSILRKNNVVFNVNALIPFKNITDIVTMYDEYHTKLRNVIPDEKRGFNFVFDYQNVILDLSKVELAFNKLYNYLTKNKIFPSEIDFFDKQIYRTQCRLYTHVTPVIDSNGNLYCCNTPAFYPNNSIHSFGNIKNISYNKIDEYKEKYFSYIKDSLYSEKCLSCQNYCKVCVMNYSKNTNILQHINDVTDEIVCNMFTIITKYSNLYKEQYEKYILSRKNWKYENKISSQ